MNIRNILERISRGVVLKRKLPKEFGNRIIFVTPEAGLRYWKFNLGTIDRMLTEVIKKYINRGDNVWDIGANIGFFSVASMYKSGNGKFLLVEPDIELCNILNKTKNANSDIELNILPIAVSDEVSISKFSIANRSRATNHLSSVIGSTQTGGTRETKYVPTLTLDSLLNYFDKPDFVKIDTEGAELLVLKGASQLLKLKPIILIEVYADAFEQINEILDKAGYNLFNADLLPKLELLNNVHKENILAIPK